MGTFLYTGKMINIMMAQNVKEEERDTQSKERVREMIEMERKV